MSPSTAPSDRPPGGGSDAGPTGTVRTRETGGAATGPVGDPGHATGAMTDHAPARAEPAQGVGLLHLAVAGAGLAVYALVSHALMVHAAQAPWAVAVLFGPLVGAIAVGAWQRRQTAVLAACVAGVGVLAAVVARGGVADVERMYVLQHAGIHFALAWAFGSTLRGGRTPLITALAGAVHTRFTPAMRAYTRWLTGVWALYFVAMVGVSVAVYALAPWSAWSLFCNVLTPLAAGALFVGEHLLRYRRHPEFERVSLRSAIGAYRQRGADKAAAPVAPAARGRR